MVVYFERKLLQYWVFLLEQKQPLCPLWKALETDRLYILGHFYELAVNWEERIQNLEASLPPPRHMPKHFLNEKKIHELLQRKPKTPTDPLPEEDAD